MFHGIRTAYVESDLTYIGETLEERANYPQGILQGNTVWPNIGVP